MNDHINVYVIKKQPYEIELLSKNTWKLEKNSNVQ